jgi:hypothetical protein
MELMDTPRGMRLHNVIDGRNDRPAIAQSHDDGGVEA